ncbi:hypothetical protein [Thalassomonas sp. M1454]|uniref:hypothetical protein n=1 Tax=Thalassomonas sp. M1454 TaxID=2594477 RepID=UPI00117E67F2|nr:hypothetical protein [Thalassomonas sp. M1454]TRX57433.1 hypothetical protein FNN08_08030 [Thalassomonas sp. M1454]
MNCRNSFTFVLFGFVLAFTSFQSAYAVERSEYKFNKEMQVTITTVTGNYFRSYDGLVNKPLAQLIELPPQHSLKKIKDHNNSNFFELAMRMQDRMQHYIALVDELLKDNEQNINGSCETSRFAKFVSLF